MSEYLQLLDATIAHLENLRGAGVRSVSASPETLKLLVPTVRKSSPVPLTTSTGAAALRPSQGVETATPTAPPAPKPGPVASSVPRSAAAAARWNTASQSATGGASSSLPALPPPLAAPARAAAFAALQSKVLACEKCPHLVSSRRSVVFGVGNLHARILFVGEAPGADEDQQGEPFVGRAGELLTKIIQAMGLSRSDVYIANILKCRPDTPGQTSGNRKPTPVEIATCIPWLQEQINLIQPGVMVALGVSAMEGLLGKMEVNISRQRGSWTSYRGIPLMPTYHPAYLLRNQSLSEKRKVWEDMLLVMEKAGLSISDKQRGFFLTK